MAIQSTNAATKFKRKNLEDLQLAIRAELEIRITGFQTPSSKTWLSPAMHAQAQTTQVDY